MNPRAADRLSDLLNSLAYIDRLLKGKTREDLAEDPIMRAAFERFLEIISEASRHLPSEWKSDRPEVPWQEIAGIGNRLRHAYWSLDIDILWALHKDGRLRELQKAAVAIQDRYCK